MAVMEKSDEYDQDNMSSTPSEEYEEEFDESLYSLLIVDDELPILDSLERIFFPCGYTVFKASSGKHALKCLDENKVHLVISDYQMPGMNGLSLLKQVRDKWPEITRIMLTGNKEIQAIAESARSGLLYKFLTKPCQSDDLLLTVRLALQHQAVMEENKRLKEVTKKLQADVCYSAAMSENQKYLAMILDKHEVICKEKFTQAVEDC